MDAHEIVTVVGEIASDEGKELERNYGPRALAAARGLEATLRPHLEGNPAYAPLWQQFRAAPQRQAPILAGVVQVVMEADPTLACRLSTLLADYRQARAADSAVVRTGGGAYVGGSVTVSGGEFVGRDRTTVYATGGSAVALGQGSRAAATHQGVDPEALARAFRELHAAVEARPHTAPEDKADLRAELQELEQEVARGDQADEGFIARRLRNLRRMAPDILEILLATAANPLSGLGAVARKVAEKMRADAQC